MVDDKPFKVDWNNTKNVVTFILSNDVTWHPSSFLIMKFMIKTIIF